jgi:hypothetical protein
MALVALRRFVDKQLSKNRKRSPFEYVVLATMGVLVAAVLKYPNRAFLTRARPDLKTPNGYPLLGNMPQMLRDQGNTLHSMNEGFKNLGNVYSLTIPLFGRVILVNTPEHFEHVLKSRSILH